MTELFFEYIFPLIIIALKVVAITSPLILCVAYLTYAERRVI
ncbi:MAG: NADH-quinone oxidoreductase subunit H, partial [Candidatus Midichloria mitochondrii]|nr:NADH-quinone oxidoreductase subunit H [Candidatus Midichloria mitochondrii]